MQKCPFASCSLCSVFRQCNVDMVYPARIQIVFTRNILKYDCVHLAICQHCHYVVRVYFIFYFSIRSVRFHSMENSNRENKNNILLRNKRNEKFKWDRGQTGITNRNWAFSFLNVNNFIFRIAFANPPPRESKFKIRNYSGKILVQLIG